MRQWVGERVMPSLPSALREKLLPPENRWSWRDLSATARTRNPKADTRLLISPNNYAGQAYYWAQAAGTLPGVDAVNLKRRAGRPGFDFPTHFEVKDNVAEASRIWARRQEKRVLSDFTHLLLEGARLPYSGNCRGSVQDYVDFWQQNGLRVGLIWHGADIRTPSAHGRLEPHSHLGNAFGPYRPEVQEYVEAMHAIADELAVPEFVSTPDLLVYRPAAAWLPTIADPEVWRSPTRDPGERPVVLHAPSRPHVKGSRLIREVNLALEEDGLVTYKEARGLPSSQMPELVASADLVIDQLPTGAYGVASVEAMLSGKVVVAHVSEGTRSRILRDTGLELPIVEATPETLSTVMRDLVGDSRRLMELGAQGLEFARSVHSTEKAAEVLRGFLLD